MAIFCIPKNLVSKLKDSALKGNVDISKLYDMSSRERRDFFASHTDESLGKFINTEFEKAMVSEQQNALTDWATSVFTPKAQAKPEFKNVLDKINQLSDMGVLTPETEKAFLEDLVSDKLGVNVSPEEVAQIHQRATKLQELQAKAGDNLGTPSARQDTVDFYVAKKGMDDYLQALNPASNLKVLTGTIGRGMMLASVKSPILNIASNTEIAITEALARRLSGGAARGADSKMAMDYMKMAQEVYQKSGYDITRMTSISDGGVSGGRVLGEMSHSEGKGPIRKVGRIVEDTVFKQFMGAPDVAFSSAHFADSVNLNAMKMAKGNKEAASTMMQDAMRLVPQTEAGELLRAQAIQDASYATFTNKTWASKASEWIRKGLNDVSGDVRAGDYLMPFVKTPANVIATGLDYAGGGAVKSLHKVVKAIYGRNTEALKDPEVMRDLSRDIIRSGLGLSGAAVIAYNLKDDDFVGAYDPKRAQIEALRNSNTNSVRIGGKWISLDWFGPLGVPLSSIMYARKYGDTGPEKVFQYAQGVKTQLAEIPGIEAISDLYDQLTTKAQSGSLGEAATSTWDYLMGEAASRLIPSGLSDIAKATDTMDRETGKSVLDRTKAKIPGLRQALPEKENIFGEPVKGEGPISDILFGSRIKTDKEDDTLKEINRVATVNDKGVTFTDWKKSNSKQLAQFKQKMGPEVYGIARKEYGKMLKQRVDGILAHPKYQELDDAGKLDKINAADTDAMNRIFQKYSFRYVSEKK